MAAQFRKNTWIQSVLGLLGSDVARCNQKHLILTCGNFSFVQWPRKGRQLSLLRLVGAGFKRRAKGLIGPLKGLIRPPQGPYKAPSKGLIRSNKAPEGPYKV